MARIWMSGLEAGHIHVFDSYSGASISAAQARTGAYSLYIGDNSYYAAAALPASISEVFVRFGMRAPYSTQSVLLTLFDSGGDPQITLLLNRNALTIEVRRGKYDDTVIARGGEIHRNRWHCIEFRLLVADAGGRFELKVDGTQVINYTGDTQATANANIASFRFGMYVVSNGQESYYDDIAFNDVAGGVNDTWIGRGGIPAIFPEGAGTYTQLTANVGPNWDDVNEVPPDEDITYVYHDIIDREDSYATEDLVNTGTISAVQWLARARSDFAGVPEIARLLRIGGVDHSGADIGIDADYDYYPEIFDQDPNAGPGAWTVAAINGMEVGVKIR